MKPELAKAFTYHKRIGGPQNAFRYSVDYVLSEPEAKSGGPALFSWNRFNLASVFDCDHGGPRKNGRGTAWVRKVITENDLTELNTMRVLLLAQPRMLGYVFNPVSFWLIVDEAEQLRAFIAEVNNTFGDRHSYLCHHDDLRPIKSADTLQVQKQLHVSPFQKVAGTYRFRVTYSANDIGVRIDFRIGKGGLLATLSAKRTKMTNVALIWSAVRRPFGSVRVVFLIHAQALVLKMKGAKYLRRPEPPKAEVSR